ncbi:hypothetical protein [Mycobacteroides abscessus]|uniref:hypothetical protein n=1 Tax=Mycobacteroides abscessus TaxID=36809 RepID=UPI0009271F0F|nr:hypothetical protein [Mycobacteroides abscessus]SHO82887.1 Uncharacterised protein [Mycobacteroides abscessus subsp. abscessus]SHP60089.1 Uncharacterised protein [Mycobacteroides abscessus subsp. abscessus]SHP82251.1 Uncharacterised protein [Mycobacteroides abscessus subsp. abscessus]SHP94986.1 Uncharacterised protein [Mycobacteroides abscessus subsp. abscessus]SHQ50072.1 Uncharacterised protein [Mycobacteroides abscessus subsp. abscessus]
MGTVATTGDPVIQMHKGVAASARSAVAGLPTVDSVGMRSGHAEILESALGETRRTLEGLAHVADVGARGAGALGDQDRENGRKYGSAPLALRGV